VIVFDATRDILEAPRTEMSETRDGYKLLAVDAPANSVAVLPFTNISSEPDNEFFCDGISEEILNKLGTIVDLHVIGRTSSFAFKDSDYRIPQIAALLGARYLLQGSVRRHGDQLRISAQLVDETGAQRWSDTFDRQLDNIFVIQSEIADAVTERIASHVTPHAEPSRAPDLDAYEHYLIGRDLWHRRNRGALDELRSAIALDPDFAEAHVEFAIVRLFGYPNTEELAEADRAIGRALELKPGMPRALAARGLWFQQQTPKDYASSEPLLREALAKNPNMTDAMNWLSGVLQDQGKDEEGLALLERAYATDPFHGAISSNLAGRYFERGDFERAERMMQRQLELPIPSRIAFVWLRDFYASIGQLVKMNDIEKRLALTGLHVYWGLAQNYAMLNSWQKAEYWTQRSIRDFPNLQWARLFPAAILEWQGRFTDAADSIELGSLQEMASGYYGQSLVLSGQLEKGVAELEQTYGSTLTQLTLDPFLIDALQAYAWALQQLDRGDEATTLLDDIDAIVRLGDRKARRADIQTAWIRNAALRGEPDLALDRLEQAVAMGWLGYYVVRHDPRLATLSEKPRYEALMADVIADIERQRAIVEQNDTSEDFIALLDNAQAARRAAESN
ncbi:MAG: tetratricopeptide repeat protein, partial [Gammaproteobacteria bacterium]